MPWPTRCTRRAFAAVLGAAAAARPGAAWSQVPPANAGDWVVCTNDHRIARLNRPLTPGEAPPLSALSGWTMAPPASLPPAPPCPRCGAIWFRTAPGRRAQVLVEAKGWQPDQ